MRILYNLLLALCLLILLATVVYGQKQPDLFIGTTPQFALKLLGKPIMQNARGMEFKYLTGDCTVFFGYKEEKCDLIEFRWEGKQLRKVFRLYGTRPIDVYQYDRKIVYEGGHTKLILTTR